MGKAQLVRTGGAQWSDEAEELFFDNLYATCNVRASARAAGFSAPTVYRQRRMRPEFAARWDACLADGYAQLEIELVRTALEMLHGLETPPEPEDDAQRPLSRMTIDQAMKLLSQRRPETRGGRRARVRSFDEVRASIARKVEAIIAARGGEPRPDAEDPGAGQ
jgi:hypothetical protein